MELSDAQVEVLHELLIECLVYGNPDSFDEDEKGHLSELLEEVTAVAKKRHFWWA